MEKHFLTERRKYRCPNAPESVREDAKRIKEERIEMNKAKLKKAKNCKFTELEKLLSLQKGIEQRSETLLSEIQLLHRNITGSASGPTKTAHSPALEEWENYLPRRTGGFKSPSCIISGKVLCSGEYFGFID